MCLVETPAKIIRVKNILIDTTVIKDEIQQINHNDFITVTGDLKLWIPVVCDFNDYQRKRFQQGFNSKAMMQL